MSAGSGSAWIDGEPATDRLLRDRAVHYGDGVFETMSVSSGHVRFATLHAARLAEGCRRLGIDCDADAVLSGAVATSVPADGEGMLKLIVSRGDAAVRGYGTTGGERPRVLHYWYPGAAAPRPAQLTAVTLRQRWGENPELAGIKHLNRLEQVLARRELAASGADEGIAGSSSGHVVSGTSSNVFLRLHGRLCTPRVERCGIAGVLRAVVLREAGRSGIAILEGDVFVAELSSATALGFSNARMGLWPATRLDGRTLARDAELTRLADLVAGLRD